MKQGTLRLVDFVIAPASPSLVGDMILAILELKVDKKDEREGLYQLEQYMWMAKGKRRAPNLKGYLIIRDEVSVYRFRGPEETAEFDMIPSTLMISDRVCCIYSMAQHCYKRVSNRVVRCHSGTSYSRARCTLSVGACAVRKLVCHCLVYEQSKRASS